MTTPVEVRMPIGAETMAGTVKAAAAPVESLGRAEGESPISLRLASWLERRYCDSGNGCYAIAALQEAIAARGRIDEPWLIAYLQHVTSAVVSGGLDKGRGLRRDRGKGQDAADSGHSLGENRSAQADPKP